MLAKLKGKRGFTLVELMIVVAIIGVLAALAIYGVRKYISNAKSAEARMTLGRIAKDASSAFNRESMSATVLAPGGTGAISNALCTSATAAVPVAVANIRGVKYQSTVADWQNPGDSAIKGWVCLKFSMQDPQYYQYNYASTATTFTGTAIGDLNGDGTVSTFQILGAVQAGVVNTAPTISETNPDE